MKWMLIIVASGCLILGVGAHLVAKKPSSPTPLDTRAETNQSTSSQVANTNQAKAAPVVQPPRPQVLLATPLTRTNAVSGDPARPNFDEPAIFDHAISSLISPETSFTDKQAIWKLLKDSGHFPQTIAALEQRASDNPNSADTAASLGEAYLKQCAMTNDMRQQAIYAMKADQTFETALGLDSNNWDARFYRAVSMSYWPANLNKGQDVIDNFQTLIQQQEGKPPQPQYALPYVWLGDQYQKSGAADSAAQVWQVGLALFPDNTELKGRVNGHH